MLDHSILSHWVLDRNNVQWRNMNLTWGAGRKGTKAGSSQGWGHSLKALKMLAASLEVQMGWRSGGRAGW